MAVPLRSLALGVLLPALVAAAQPAQPLWSGARYTHAQRDRAVERGLQFIYGIASQPDNFTEWGSDLLWCFFSISATAQDARLRQAARAMGLERAREWRRIHATVPSGAGADDIADLVFGSDAAERLGVPDARLREQLRRAAARFSAIDFLGFDAPRQPPPCDDPPSSLKRYDVWSDALITAYSGQRYGVRLGASYRDVIRWIAVFRPYPPREQLDAEAFLRVVYAITHVVYTLNDYGKYRLSPAWLPAEYQYLREHLWDAIQLDDAETTGEFLDTLRALGMTEEEPRIRVGVEYVLDRQNADGSWGDPKDTSVYNRYHSTWTAVDGLRQYRWQGRRLSFPELRSVIGGGTAASRRITKASPAYCTVSTTGSSTIEEPLEVKKAR